MVKECACSATDLDRWLPYTGAYVHRNTLLNYTKRYHTTPQERMMEMKMSMHMENVNIEV